MLFNVCAKIKDYFGAHSAHILQADLQATEERAYKMHSTNLNKESGGQPRLELPYPNTPSQTWMPRSSYISRQLLKTKLDQTL